MKRILFLLMLLPISAWMLQGETVRGLGTATFSTSTRSSAARSEFIRGLLLLHVFEYTDAAKAFVAAEKMDSGFAMAYWAEAMTFNHPVWNQVDESAGKAALARFGATPEARQGRIADPRERAWMSAVELLYSSKGTKRERDARYATAMQEMSRAYPADDEVQLFCALALLGRSEGVRDVPTYLQSAGMAKAVFMRHPNHPGAAHYWIHGMDDPRHASGALVAARALSKIAPDAGHAQHMCSHIFMALGMWDDVVRSNVNAMRVVDDHARSGGQAVVDCGHYAIWLEYAFYQKGRGKDGDHVLAECARTGTEAEAWLRSRAGDAKGAAQKAQAGAAQVNSSLAEMRAIAIVESEDWNGPAPKMTVEMKDLGPMARGYVIFGTGYAAAERGDGGLAASSLANLRMMADEAGKKTDAEAATDLSILADDLGGLIASKSGDVQGAITQVQRAAAKYDGMAFDFGPPSSAKPPDELLGELLLEEKQAAQARHAFATSLKRAPRRAKSMLGLARAESAMGDRAAAVVSYRELLKIWKDADPEYAPVGEAERYIAVKSGVQ